MPKLTKMPKPAFPRERYERRSQSLNRYWDAEDAKKSRLSGAVPRKHPSEDAHTASEVVQVRMKKPARIVRDRKERPKKKLTPQQIIRRVVTALIGVGIVGAALFMVLVFPNLPPILNLRAARALEDGEPQRAETLYLRSVEKDPSNTDTILTYVDLIDDNSDVNTVIAFLQKWNNGDSRIETMLGELLPTVSVAPAAGTYDDFEQVTITTPRSDVVLHYTTDGGDVTPDSPIYTGPFYLPEGATEVQVLGVAKNGARSEIADCRYEVRLRQPQAVTASQEPGVYDRALYVNLTAADGDIIRYTTDGSEPTVNSLIYQPSVSESGETGMLLDSGVTTIRAISITPQGVVSDESSFTYDLSDIPPEPVEFDQEGGYFYGTVVLHLTSNRDDSLIYYTTNGLDPVPDTYFTYLYENEIVLEVGFNAPIRAVAITPEGVYSEVTVQGYTVRSSY